MTKQVDVVIIGSGNKTVDELAKKYNGLLADIQKHVGSRDDLLGKIEVEEDVGKKTRMQTSVETVQSEIETIQKSIQNVGIRPATEDERRTALQGIANMDVRRRQAPNFIQAGKAFVLVPVQKVKNTDVSTDEVVVKPEPKVKKAKKAS